MWPVRKKSSRYFTLAIRASDVSIGLISQEGNAPPTLHCYQRITKNIWHIGQLQTILAPFFFRNSTLQTAPILISVAAPFVCQIFDRASILHPSPYELNSARFKHLVWDYRYILSSDEGSHLFYLCGIHPSVLASLQMVSRKLNLLIGAISTEYITSIQAYCALYGPAFRQSQLARDLSLHNYNPASLIDVHLINRLLTINPALSLDNTIEKDRLLTLAGLYYQEQG